MKERSSKLSHTRQYLSNQHDISAIHRAQTNVWHSCCGRFAASLCSLAVLLFFLFVDAALLHRCSMSFASHLCCALNIHLCVSAGCCCSCIRYGRHTQKKPLCSGVSQIAQCRVCAGQHALALVSRAPAPPSAHFQFQ